LRLTQHQEWIKGRKIIEAEMMKIMCEGVAFGILITVIIFIGMVMV
jgi:hypothetical protein